MSGYICPVCGWSDLPHYPANNLICSCCGTEFDFDNAFNTNQELLQKWIENGEMWFSIYRPAPYWWDARKQIQSIAGIDVLALNLKSSEDEVVNKDIVRVWWSEKDRAYIAIVHDRPSISGVGDTAKYALEELVIAQNAVISTLEEDREEMIKHEVRKGLKYSTDQITPKE